MNFDADRGPLATVVGIGPAKDPDIYRIAALEARIAALETWKIKHRVPTVEWGLNIEERVDALEVAFATLERRHNAVEDAMGCHDHQPFWEALVKQRAVHEALAEWMDDDDTALSRKVAAAVREALK